MWVPETRSDLSPSAFVQGQTLVNMFSMLSQTSVLRTYKVVQVSVISVLKNDMPQAGVCVRPASFD